MSEQWATEFKKAYQKYKKQNPGQDLPDYSDLIGEYFFKLSDNISNLPLAPDIPGSLWRQVSQDNYRIREYLSKSKVGKIVFHGSAGALEIKSKPIISEIIRNLFRKIDSHPLEKPTAGEPPGSLARLLATSKELILELKKEGITDRLLVEFIPGAVTYEHPSALRINPSFNVKVGSVVPIVSVGAFQKALKRA